MNHPFERGVASALLVAMLMIGSQLSQPEPFHWQMAIWIAVISVAMGLLAAGLTWAWQAYRRKK